MTGKGAICQQVFVEMNVPLLLICGVGPNVDNSDYFSVCFRMWLLPWLSE